MQNFCKIIVVKNGDSDEVYGDSQENEDRKDEKSNLNPTNPYAASKASCELILQAYSVCSFFFLSLTTKLVKYDILFLNQVLYHSAYSFYHLSFLKIYQNFNLFLYSLQMKISSAF